MTLRPYFSSSAKVWDDIQWVYGIEEAGYAGWEIVADGNYRLEKPDNLGKIKEVIAEYPPRDHGGMLPTGISISPPSTILSGASPSGRSKSASNRPGSHRPGSLSIPVPLPRRKTPAKEGLGTPERGPAPDREVCGRAWRACLPRKHDQPERISLPGRRGAHGYGRGHRRNRPHVRFRTRTHACESPRISCTGLLGKPHPYPRQPWHFRRTPSARRRYH